jgi:ketosteroid isomerase-like protein
MIKYFPILSVLSVALFACSDDVKQRATNEDSPQMVQYKKDQRNKAIALQCIRAYGAKDIEFILSHNAENVVNIYEGQAPIHGIDSCRIILQEAFSTMKEYKPSHQRAVADSNYVFVYLYVHISSVKSTETYDAKMVEIFKFNDEGKIILHNGVGEPIKPTEVKHSL